MLAAQADEHLREHQTGDGREDCEPEEAGERHERRPGRGAVDREQDDRERDAGDVLEDAPARAAPARSRASSSGVGSG